MLSSAVQIHHRCRKAAVPQKLADSHEIDSGFEKSCRVGMSQGVGTDMLANPRRCGRQAQRLLNHCIVERIVVGSPRKEVIGWPLLFPISSQFGQETR